MARPHRALPTAGAANPWFSLSGLCPPSLTMYVRHDLLVTRILSFHRSLSSQGGVSRSAITLPPKRGPNALCRTAPAAVSVVVGYGPCRKVDADPKGSVGQAPIDRSSHRRSLVGTLPKDACSLRLVLGGTDPTTPTKHVQGPQPPLGAGVWVLNRRPELNQVLVKSLQSQPLCAHVDRGRFCLQGDVTASPKDCDKDQSPPRPERSQPPPSTNSTI
jgi:hypothetical protein